MTISDIKVQKAEYFSGEFRATASTEGKAGNGNRFLRFGLRDPTGNLRAHGWPGEYIGPKEIIKNVKLAVEGRLDWYDGIRIAKIMRAKIIDSPEDNPLMRTPIESCPINDGVFRLYTLLEDIKIRPLRKFALSVFRNEHIRTPFLLNPASRKNHHSIPGGLLIHSIECAESVRSQPGFDKKMLDIGTVAALFHDIGKIRTLREDGRTTREGLLLEHDFLVFEILAPYLHELDSVNPNIGNALRYIWWWHLHGAHRQNPKSTIAEAVRAADRISSGLFSEQLAFKDAPKWASIANLDNRHYWRTPPEIH